MNYLQGQHPRLVMGMNIRDGASNQRQSFGQIIEIWLLSRTYSRVSNHVHRISLELPRINEKDTVHRLSYIKMYLHIQATVYRLPRTSMFLARSSLEGIELLPACEFCRSSCIFLHLSVRQLTTRAPINQLSSFWWPRETDHTRIYIWYNCWRPCKKLFKVDESLGQSRFLLAAYHHDKNHESKGKEIMHKLFYDKKKCQGKWLIRPKCTWVCIMTQRERRVRFLLK